MKMLRTVEKFTCQRIRKEAREKFEKGLKIASELLYGMFKEELLEGIVIDIKKPYTRLPKNTILGGWYNRREPNLINVCTSALNFEWKNEYYIAGVIAHEIGHLIHYRLYDGMDLKLPKQGMSRYAMTNHKEDFAEAFAELVVDHKSYRGTRTKEDIAARDEAMRVLLANFLKEKEEVKVETQKEKFARICKQAHELTRIAKRCSNGKIDYRTQYGIFFKELYRFENFEELKFTWESSIINLGGVA